MGKKIKILYQFATAKLKTPNGNKEVLKRKKFLEKNIGTNTTIKLSIPNKGPGSIETEYDEAIEVVDGGGVALLYLSDDHI